MRSETVFGGSETARLDSCVFKEVSKFKNSKMIAWNRFYRLVFHVLEARRS